MGSACGQVTAHTDSAHIGEVRRVTHIRHGSFYSIPVDKIPDDHTQAFNVGEKTLVLDSSCVEFHDDICSVYYYGKHAPDRLIMSFRILDDETAKDLLMKRAKKREVAA